MSKTGWAYPTPIQVSGCAPIRFWQKYTDRNGCWVWDKYITKQGYGRTTFGGRVVYAHRVAYTLAYGTIPNDLVIDHKCRNRACIKPEHLEAVTLTENILRGASPSAICTRTNECYVGHPFSFENTLYDRGQRYCRECRIIRRHKAA